VKIFGALLIRKKDPFPTAPGQKGFLEVECVIRRPDGSIRERTVERTPIIIGAGKTEIIADSGGEK
jgi:hypothetical protein